MEKIVEKISPQDAATLRKELADVDIKVQLSEAEIQKILKYLDRNHAVSTILSPDVLSTFLHFAKDIGFPSTLGMARMALHTNASNSTATSEEMIDVLKSAKLLKSYSLPGGIMTKLVNRDWREDKDIKKNPEKEIEILDYDDSFVEDLGMILGRFGLKSESESIKMSIISEMEIVKNDIKRLLESHSANDDMPSHEEENFFHHLDNDAIEKFADGLVLVLGELQAQGRIPAFDKASDAKAALMATIKKLYQSRSEVGKIARKYQRFGVSRILRTAKRDISNAQRRRD